MPIKPYRLCLSAQRGLWGHVTPSLRAVCIASEGNKIISTFYYDRPLKEETKELVEDFLDDLTSDFHIDDEGNEMEFITDIIVLPPNGEKPPLVGDWVYYRYEDRQGRGASE